MRLKSYFDLMSCESCNIEYALESWDFIESFCLIVLNPSFVIIKKETASDET